MARTRPATISELESFAQADPDTASPGMDLKYYLRRAEEHQRAGKELASGAGKGSTESNPRGSWDAGTYMEQAFVEYARARTLILETIPAHRDYSTLFQRKQRANLATTGQEILQNLGRLKTALVERYERYERGPAAFADAVPIFLLPSDTNINEVQSPSGPIRDRGESRYVDDLFASWGRRERALSVLMPPQGFPPGESLEDLEAQIYACVINILNSRDARHEVRRLQGSDAQCCLDVIQHTLDQGSLPTAKDREQARRLMGQLSEAHDQLPSSLFITGVDDRDEHPTFAGGFGDIYRAFYQGKRVALKRLRTLTTDSTSHPMRLGFCREALVWQGLRHRFILPLIGIDRTTFPSSFCMVSPWMKNGTVLKYLKDRGRADVDRLLLETAQGLDYLHSQNIVHGDLRGTNILISDDNSACLSDFGLTTSVSDVESTTAMLTSSSNHGGSVHWLAPELISPTTFGCEKFVRTPASDVYAYACVCLELYTGSPPLSDVKPEVAAMLRVIQGERAHRPVEMSEELWHLVTAAWAANSHNRPTIHYIVSAFRGSSPAVLSTAIYNYEDENPAASADPRAVPLSMLPRNINLNSNANELQIRVRPPASPQTHIHPQQIPTDEATHLRTPREPAAVRPATLAYSLEVLEEAVLWRAQPEEAAARNSQLVLAAEQAIADGVMVGDDRLQPLRTPRPAVPAMRYIDDLLASWQHRERAIPRPFRQSFLPPGRSLDDIEAQICACVINLLNSRDATELVPTLEGSVAVCCLDAIHHVLDQGSLVTAQYRGQARRLIGQLSERQDRLPSSFFIEIKDRDEHPTLVGGFGEFYRAFHHEKMVALTHITESTSHSARIEFCREALLWHGLRHRFILPLIGINNWTFPGSRCMVSPWMKNGTVLDFLQYGGRTDVNRLLLEIGEGLDYLHAQNIVHGDLRGTNILISDDNSACLSNFGLATWMSEAESTTAMAASSTDQARSVRWWSPELIDPTRFGCQTFVRTSASDVYAYGCVCLELYSGRPPFSEVSDEVAMLRVTQGERPQRPADMSEELWRLVTAALAEDSRTRPTIHDIVSMFPGSSNMAALMHTEPEIRGTQRTSG